MRLLDWDIENRPLSYWQPDRPTAEITAIAYMWIVNGVPQHDTLTALLLGEMEYVDMLTTFRKELVRADMSTGHYMRRHDLPILNGALYETGLPLLPDILVSDTKLDMFTKADVPATQEWLTETLQPVCPKGIPLEKFHMTQSSWREANRLTKKGLELTRRRVTSDVHTHAHIREGMLDRGWLGEPKVWKSRGTDVVEGRRFKVAKTPQYTIVKETSK